MRHMLRVIVAVALVASAFSAVTWTTQLQNMPQLGETTKLAASTSAPTRAGTTTRCKCDTCGDISTLMPAFTKTDVGKCVKIDGDDVTVHTCTEPSPGKYEYEGVPVAYQVDWNMGCGTDHAGDCVTAPKVCYHTNCEGRIKTVDDMNDGMVKFTQDNACGNHNFTCSEHNNGNTKTLTVGYFEIPNMGLPNLYRRPRVWATTNSKCTGVRVQDECSYPHDRQGARTATQCVQDCADYAGKCVFALHDDITKICYWYDKLPEGVWFGEFAGHEMKAQTYSPTSVKSYHDDPTDRTFHFEDHNPTSRFTCYTESTYTPTIPESTTRYPSPERTPSPLTGQKGEAVAYGTPVTKAPSTLAPSATS